MGENDEKYGNEMREGSIIKDLPFCQHYQEFEGCL
jgi:hypothetical protein